MCPDLPSNIVIKIFSEFVPIDVILQDKLYMISKKYRYKIIQRALIIQPLSPRQRRQFWLFFCTKAIPENIDILAEFNRQLSAPRTEESLNEIERDVVRTMPGNPLFSPHTDIGLINRSKLRNVLLAISSAVPTVGYCQGMNFVAGTLLIHLEFCQIYSYFMFLQILKNYHFNLLRCFRQEFAYMIFEIYIYRFVSTVLFRVWCSSRMNECLFRSHKLLLHWFRFY